MHSSDQQHAVVESHFQRVCSEWGTRYECEPCKMSDLDLQLRLDNVLELMQPLIQSRTPAMRLLDVGCGAGNLLDSLYDQPVALFGVDAVPDMIEQAQRAIAEPLDKSDRRGHPRRIFGL